jgi:signal transduction histidine kinase
MLYSLFGIIVFGLVSAAFLSRLALDIGELKARALAIVKGYRGSPLEVNRGDEIGSLMASVNSIQDELRQRETQIELERQQRFHREKMAAVGSLAAAVAHEINNPIAAIAGVAEAIQDQCRGEHCPNLGQSCRPGLILEQARRVSSITRQLAEFSAPPSQGAQLTDLNGLVRNTLSFVSYDRRLRGVQLDTELDVTLPAVTLVEDYLTQVLMNLLLNAADAQEGRNDKRILVMTQAQPDGVVLQVKDNGSGMDAETLAHAFDEYYSTKPSGKGTGLGLAVCKSLMESMGGEITLNSEPGAGTTATLRIPFTAPETEGDV